MAPYQVRVARQFWLNRLNGYDENAAATAGPATLLAQDFDKAAFLRTVRGIQVSEFEELTSRCHTFREGARDVFVTDLLTPRINNTSRHCLAYLEDMREHNGPTTQGNALIALAQFRPTRGTLLPSLKKDFKREERINNFLLGYKSRCEEDSHELLEREAGTARETISELLLRRNARLMRRKVPEYFPIGDYDRRADKPAEETVTTKASRQQSKLLDKLASKNKKAKSHSQHSGIKKPTSSSSVRLPGPHTWVDDASVASDVEDKAGKKKGKKHQAKRDELRATEEQIAVTPDATPLPSVVNEEVPQKPEEPLVAQLPDYALTQHGDKAKELEVRNWLKNTQEISRQFSK